MTYRRGLHARQQSTEPFPKTTAQTVPITLPCHAADEPPPATKAIPTEPLLTYNANWLIQSMAVLIFYYSFDHWLCRVSTRLKQILARITADLIPPGAEPRLHRAGTSAETDVDDLLPIPRANCIFHRLGADEVGDNTR